MSGSFGIKALVLMALFGAGFTAPVTVVDQAVDLGYSRHIVERLPHQDVQAILDSALGTADCRPSATVVSC